MSGSSSLPSGMKLAIETLKCDQSAGATGFGFVTKRSASGRAELEKEIRATMEGRSFPFNLHDTVREMQDP
jgi:hypothetical protein